MTSHDMTSHDMTSHDITRHHAHAHAHARARTVVHKSATMNSRGLLQRPADQGNATADKPNVTLALLLPLTGAWQGGHWIAGAAALAVKDVNEDPTLLPGHNHICHTLSHGLYSHGLYSRGLYSYGKDVNEDPPLLPGHNSIVMAYVVMARTLTKTRLSFQAITM